MLWLTVLIEGNGEIKWPRNKMLIRTGTIISGRSVPTTFEWKMLDGPESFFVSMALAKSSLHRLVGALGGAVMSKALAELLSTKLPKVVVLNDYKLGFDVLRWSSDLCNPPGPPFTHPLFYQAKALEALSLIAGASTLSNAGRAGKSPAFQTSRRELLARERVAKAQALMTGHIEEPLNLNELSGKVGCSPFYLSRTFSKYASCTLQEYQRRVRLHRAAELLRSGKYNVTEAALAVGYNSLSHFTKTFRETFGCCPGLYPVHVCEKTSQTIEK